MKRNSIITLTFLAVTLLFTACKKEDVAPENLNVLKLEGQWQLKSANFLSDELGWDEEVPYTFMNYFKYAPAMYEDLKGFDFMKQKTDNGVGYRLEYVRDEDYVSNPDEDSYWHWNYLDNKEGFELVQTNHSLPPYDFTIENIRNIKITNEGNTISFKGDAFTKLSGQGNNVDLISVPVEYKMVRGAAKNNPEVYLNGVLFELEIE